MKRYIILDCHYLCYRAFFSMKGMVFAGAQTGVLFGFFRELCSLSHKFKTNKVIFCFDAFGSKRKEYFPTYKQKRHKKEKTPEELAELESFRTQIQLLRDGYLPEIGFTNIFWKDGYESDDFIARAIEAIKEKHEDVRITIVTGDRDMYQLIANDVVVYHPDKRLIIDKAYLQAKLKMTPKEYRRYLALAGCKTDEVPGVPGVGEKTAVRFLHGSLPTTSEAYKKIRKNWQDTVLRNKKLVGLPWPDTPTVEIRKNQLRSSGWNKCMKQMGIRSLQDEFFNPPKKRKIKL